MAISRQSSIRTAVTQDDLGSAIAILLFSTQINTVASPRTYLTWRNLAEHILQNIHVNDNDPSTHTLHIALDLSDLISKVIRILFLRIFGNV